MLIGLIGLIGLIFIGCGIKGPPVPPQQPSVSAVENLDYEISGSSARLSWSLAVPLSVELAKNAAFGLFRSRSFLETAPCKGCPQIFEKVLEIPFVSQRSKGYETEIPLDFGYRYLFKVRLETQAGIGPDSNTIQFDFLDDSTIFDPKAQ